MHKKLSLSLLILSIAITIPQPTWACIVPPARLFLPLQDMVNRSNKIVLAKATAHKNDTYSFKTIRVLKGNVNPTFQINSATTPANSNSNHFDNHKDKNFWKPKSWGRESNHPDCQIHPSFKIGLKYLLFLDKPYTTKSFELIVSSQDDWLKAVEKEIKLNDG